METLIDRIELKALLRGKEEGKTETLISNIKSLISKNYTFEESCNLLDINNETREKLLDTENF